MNAYFIQTKTRTRAKYVMLGQGEKFKRIMEFMVLDKENESDLPFRISGTCQDGGIKEEQFMKLDFLEAFGGIPIFSENLYELLGEKLKDNIIFFKSEIRCGTTARWMYIGKIIMRLNLVDIEKMKAEEPDREFRKVIIYERFDNDFLIVRQNDIHEAVYLVSERFKNLCEKNKLNIGFLPANNIS